VFQTRHKTAPVSRLCDGWQTAAKHMPDRKHLILVDLANWSCPENETEGQYFCRKIGTGEGSRGNEGSRIEDSSWRGWNIAKERQRKLVAGAVGKARFIAMEVTEKWRRQAANTPENLVI